MNKRGYAKNNILRRMRRTERVTWPLNYSFLSFPMFNCLLTDKGYATGQNYTMSNTMSKSGYTKL